MTEKSTNIKWHETDTPEHERYSMLGQRGSVLWITGLSGSGKSTIAMALERKLLEQKHFAFVLDGDNIRHGLNANLGFSENDRNENIRRITEVAKLFADAGVICITSFISPFKGSRDEARNIIGSKRFLEIHIATDLAVCEERDSKGLYKKARAGEIKEFTGISSPYEPPENPDCVIDTSKESTEDSIRRILEVMDDRKLYNLPNWGF